MPSKLGRLPVLRSLKQRPAVVRAWSIGHRSRLVRERARFVARELAGRRGEACYTLAGSDLRVHVRHGSSDLIILEEVFGMRLYEMPQEVRAALSAAAPPLRVLDLGGHVGLFALWALEHDPSATITALEPDPANAAVLRRTIEANGRTQSWNLVQAVAAAADGTAGFHAGRFAESRLAQDGDAGTVRTAARDALALMDEADLVKIDIEGGEWPILQDPRLKATHARAIALEYHPDGARADAHRLLNAAGFQTRDIVPAPIGAGMLWAWR